MVIILQIHLSLKQKNIILTCFESCVIFNAADAATFAITDKKTLHFSNNFIISRLWQQINQGLNEEITGRDINLK